MNKTAAILSAENDRAQTTAQIILCSLAAVCTVGVIWAIGHRSGTSALIDNTNGVGNNQATDPTNLASASVQDLPLPYPGGISNSIFPAANPSAAVSANQFPTTLDQSTITSNPSISQRTSPPLGTPLEKPALPPGRELKNPQIIEAVEAARLARKAGDTATALESLRAADLRQPQHPEILSEMALTYEALSLRDKAKALWRSVLAMGESQAGGYYQLAKAKLEDISIPTNTLPSSPIQLGKCEAIREPLPAGGERVTIRVPIIAKPGSIIDPNRMDIHVFLFEQINDGERIEQVRAEEPQQKWISEPIDWASSEGETLDIIYDLSAPTAEELRSLGNRSFHGYIVKLFYQDRLSGEHSNPPSLQEFPPRSHNPGLDNALFPK